MEDKVTNSLQERQASFLQESTPERLAQLKTHLLSFAGKVLIRYNLLSVIRSPYLDRILYSQTVDNPSRIAIVLEQLGWRTEIGRTFIKHFSKWFFPDFEEDIYASTPYPRDRSDDSIEEKDTSDHAERRDILILGARDGYLDLNGRLFVQILVMMDGELKLYLQNISRDIYGSGMYSFILRDRIDIERVSEQYLKFYEITRAEYGELVEEANRRREEILSEISQSLEQDPVEEATHTF